MFADIDWTKVIEMFIGSVPAILVAMGGFVVAIRRVNGVAEGVGIMAADIHKVEVATNSMKDALVKATEDKALMVGHAKGVVDEKARVADIAEAKKEGGGT